MQYTCRLERACDQPRAESSSSPPAIVVVIVGVTEPSLGLAATALALAGRP